MNDEREAIATGDLTNLGLSATGHTILKRLKDQKALNEMVDGYRLGVALAIAHRVQPPSVEDRVNVFGVATVDPSGKLKSVVEAIYDNSGTTAYRLIECLADWGVRDLDRRWQAGKLDLDDVLEPR